MKKFLSLLLAVALMFTCASLVACGKKDDKDPVIGTYTLTSATENGEAIEIPEGFSSSIVVNEDGTFTMSQSMGEHTESYNGTWAKDGSTITLTPSSEGDEPVSLTIGENSLTLTEVYGEDTNAMIFTKQ